MLGHQQIKLSHDIFFFFFCFIKETVELNLHGAQSFLRSLQDLSQPRNSPHFMEPEVSLPRSQVPAPCPYPEPDRSSPFPHTPLPDKENNNILKFASTPHMRICDGKQSRVITFSGPWWNRCVCYVFCLSHFPVKSIRGLCMLSTVYSPSVEEPSFECIRSVIGVI